MASDSSDSEFEGFLRDENQPTLNTLNTFNESDIDVSEVSSVSDHSSDGEDDVDNAADAGPVEWQAETTPVVITPFTQPTHLNHQLADDANPLAFFHLLWPENLWQKIADETNRYAQQKIAASGHPDPRWHPTTDMEIRAYMSVNIMMGIKRLPAMWCYWSTNPAYGCQWISSTMPQTRYLKLSQYLHIRDNHNMPPRGQPNFDRLYKLRDLLDLLPTSFRAAYRPAQDLSVDEAMIGFKGRLSFRQYMPAKPTKWGVKVWELCESKSGYCLNFDVYTGRVEGRQPEFGLGHGVVMNMMQPYFDKQHHVYFDRFFASPKLTDDLEQRGTYSCSTVMLNRRGLPAGAKKTKLKQRGEVEFKQKGNALLTIWKDKRQVSVLSTNSNAEMVAVGNPPKLKPSAIQHYNAHMGGVDLADQLRSYYKVGRPSKKWWRYVFWFLLDVAMENAWIIYSASTHVPPARRGYDQLHFRSDVAELLRAGYTSRKHVKGRRSSPLVAAVDVANVGGHHPVRIQMKRGRAVCRQCSRAGRKTPAGYQVETSYRCITCDVPLCKVGCFAQFHP